MYRSLAVALFASTLAAPGIAFAQRIDTISPARVAVFDSCPMTPDNALQSERKAQEELFGALIGTLLAGIAGDLVKSGLNAAGDALEAASREQGFVAQGQSQFFAGKVNKVESVSRLAKFEPGERCMVLYLADKSGPVGSLFADSAAKAPSPSHFAWQSKEHGLGQEEWETKFANAGIARAPLVYVEARVLPGNEALRLFPTFVYYRQKIAKSAPANTAKSELHLSLATPLFEAAAGPGAIGSVYAGARIELPEIKPGDMFDWRDLRGVGSVWLPNQPVAGYVDKLVEGKNALATQFEVKTAELSKAEASLAKAQRLLARKPTDADLRDAVADAAVERDAARRAVAEVQGRLNGDETVNAGATNAQMRFVVIRDANKFGFALAKALKGQAEAAGKMVAEKLTPQGPEPEWSADKTAYLAAANDVEAKQRAYDSALNKGEAEAIAGAAADLRIAKAKANEAAVKLQMALPYPALFGP